MTNETACSVVSLSMVKVFTKTGSICTAPIHKELLTYQTSYGEKSTAQQYQKNKNHSLRKLHMVRYENWCLVPGTEKGKKELQQGDKYVEYNMSRVQNTHACSLCLDGNTSFVPNSVSLLLLRSFFWPFSYRWEWGRRLC